MAHWCLVRGQGQEGAAPFGTIRRLRDAFEGDGPAPQELIDAQLVERFGWTFDELDVQDMGRVYRAVAVLNARRMYDELAAAIKNNRTDVLTREHWELYKMMRDADPVPDARTGGHERDR